ncbi:MAG: DUF2283 domain-containing protein [archaeon]|nr:DUF2283 domain-containing protein [archaeon]
MEISFDKRADALYIKFRTGKFAKNKKIDDETIIDLDAKGKILGIEMLNASKRVSIKELEEVHVRQPLKAFS